MSSRSAPTSRLALLENLLDDLATGNADVSRRTCLASVGENVGENADAAAWALAAVADFWLGDFECGTAHAAAGIAAAVDDEVRALGLAAAALTAAGDATAHAMPSWSAAVVLLEAAPEPGSRWWTAVRYLLVEAALVDARLRDAQRVVAMGPLAGAAWAGHRFAAMMEATGVRTALFSGNVSEANSLLAPMRAALVPGSRLEIVVESVVGLVLGNADDVSGSVRARQVALTVDGGGHDFIDRGTLLLLAFGAIAIGDVATAAHLVFRAGNDGDLSACTLIDRALGLELLLVAALDHADQPAAEVWMAALMTLADHPTPGPTVARARGRYLLALGHVDDAITAVVESIQQCRDRGRMVEAAEGEIVLARARIAARDLGGASRGLRVLVAESDRTGHGAVRRSASAALAASGRRLPPVAGSGWSALSPRETEIARAIISGLDLGEIAAALFVSPATVRIHVSRVLCAFGVPTRIGLLAAVGEGRIPPTASPIPLSPRQDEVARLVATGATNQQIAEELGISVKGVEKHVGDILVRWRAGSRFELARTWWGSVAATGG